MPIQNVNAAFGADFDAESDPGQIVGWHEVIAMFADEAGTLAFENVGQHGVFVDVAHEQPVSIFIRESVGEIETRAAVCREVSVVANRLDIIEDVRIYMRAALLVIHAPLDNVKQVRNDAACRKSLAVIVKIESPRVG